MKQASHRPPNFVIILADDLGWGDLPRYGHREVRTPSLDLLADQGSLFAQFYVSSPVCSPTRVGLLTGRNPAELGIHAAFIDPVLDRERGMPSWLDPRFPTLPRALGEAGYVTGHYGKWHLGSRVGRGAPVPSDYGVDEWQVTGSWTDGTDLTVLENRNRSSELIIDETIDFIRRNRERPFFVNAWLLDPHLPLKPSPEQLAAYVDPSSGNPEPTHEQVYFAVVTNIDRHVGRLLAELDSLDLRQDTVVIFTSDNGPEDAVIEQLGNGGVGSTGPLRGRKRSLYEGGIRVPFIVRWPGFVPARRVDFDSVLASIDLFPTIAAWASAPIPDHLDGEYMGDVLLGGTGDRTTDLLWEWRFQTFGPARDDSPRAAVRSGVWKLLADPDDRRLELYDVRRDPYEARSLDRVYPRVTASLRATLRHWQEGVLGGYGRGMSARLLPVLDRRACGALGRCRNSALRGRVASPPARLLGLYPKTSRVPASS